mgnify:CR=1 FL=1
MHRGARRAIGNYYGPFASAGSVNTTINALQKLFLLRSCTDSFFARRDRPCLLYQIKRCSAPCVGRIDVAGYDELVSEALSTVSVREVREWLAANTGRSTLSKLKAANKVIDSVGTPLLPDTEAA